MKLTQIPGGLRLLLSSRRRKACPNWPSATQAQTVYAEQTTCFEAFRTQTFLHLDTIYSDAGCLTGNQEEAADLVVAAYTRAFREYELCQGCLSLRIFTRLRKGDTLAWLYTHLHAAFCDGVLALAGPVETLRGD